MKLSGRAFRSAAEFLDLGLARGRADQHAVAAGAVHFLDDELGQMLQHVLESRRPAAAPGRHVLQDRLLAEIELHDLGHVGIDRLVVGDAGAEGVHDVDAAGAQGAEQAGNAEEGVGTHRQRVEERVVDPAVDHVDPLRSARRAHVDTALVDEQVGTLHQFDAHLVGEEGVFEIGAVVVTGSQQHDVGLMAVAEGHRPQRGEQLLGIVGDRQDAHGREQFRGQPHHDLAVLEDVGHARRRADIVLEDIEILLAHPDEIDAGNVGMHAPGQLQPLRHGDELAVHQDLLFGDDAGAADFALAIGVRQEGVEGAHALRQPLVKELPLVMGDDARNDVERDRRLGPFGRAIGAEGDAVPAVEEIDLFACRLQPFG
jgi:hypothetical protein